MANITIYKTVNDEWHWRVVDNNANILGASSEGFQRKQYCENNLKSMPLFCLAADVKVAADMEETSPRPLSLYKNTSEEWHWRIKSSNGIITHTSSEGFPSKQEAINNLTALAAAIMEWDDPR